MKLIMTIELEYDQEMMFDPDDPDGHNWFYNDVLRGTGDEGLYLWSNHIGDEVGEVRVISIQGE